MQIKSGLTKRWMKLDNAAKIYPAARKKRWTALFRLSAELTEPIDPEILQQAQNITLRRFPSFKVRLRRGLFWYYLEHLSGAPKVQPDVGNPLVRMKLSENDGFMFRVRYYRNRIAVEIFHVLTDGTGGLSFLETLVAEYLRLRYGAEIPCDDMILNCSESATPEELEDSFLLHARGVSCSGTEPKAYQIHGTDEPTDVIHIISGMMQAKDLKEKATENNCSITEYLTAIMLLAADSLQRGERTREKHYKPVKICVPVNLRKYYGSKTLRNFSSYVNPGIEPRYGTYTLSETIRAVKGFMALEATEKKLNAKFSGNVKSEKNRILRVMPLFIKNIAMKIAFRMQGDRQYTSSISNLGIVSPPPEWQAYVQRMDFILGPLSRTRSCAACLTYQDTCILNFTRTIAQAHYERNVFTALVKEGIHVKLESNQR